jgi:peptidoglycan/xylan/chitin deacetylase (PgdA/CDA1 family)
MELLKRLPPHRRQSIIAELQAGQPGWAPPEWARLMNWTEVATLRDAGHEIGSHGCTHDLLPQLDSESRRMEVAGSMVAIERSLGVRPASFCYPNGSFDRSTIAEAEQAGYVNAVTTRWGVNRPGQSRFEFFRCDMDTRRLVDRHDRLSVARLAMRLSRYRVRGAA